jgi:hypothetical protein
MRNRLDVLIVGLFVVGLAALLVWPQPDQVTQENFDRIRKGMNRAEVESILGPPGDYRFTRMQCLPSFKQRAIELDWYTDTASVNVCLDESHGVVEMRFYEPYGGEAGYLDALLYRAKRRWQRIVGSCMGE